MDPLNFFFQSYASLQKIISSRETFDTYAERSSLKEIIILAAKILIIVNIIFLPLTVLFQGADISNTNKNLLHSSTISILLFLAYLICFILIHWIFGILGFNANKNEFIIKPLLIAMIGFTVFKGFDILNIFTPFYILPIERDLFSLIIISLWALFWIKSRKPFIIYILCRLLIYSQL